MIFIWLRTYIRKQEWTAASFKGINTTPPSPRHAANRPTTESCKSQKNLVARMNEWMKTQKGDSVVDPSHSYLIPKLLYARSNSWWLKCNDNASLIINGYPKKLDLLKTIGRN